MKQVLIRQGHVLVEDVPAPLVEPGTLLVRVDHSCISVGTEMSGVRASAERLWKRGLKQPQNVRKVVQMVATQGVAKTRAVIEGKLTAGQPTGYSAAGVVIAVGQGVEDLRPGDRVACAGAQCAHHAEVIRVPRNLTVPVPPGLSLADASTVTLGAIAMQGVRRAQPTLGETFVVLGLGILGQLTVQMLKANGCRVIGTDLNRDRISLARNLGLDVGVHPDDQDAVQHVHRLTDGYGADGVIITAASPSDAIISTAFTMCRRKGRVVLVGDVGLHLNRADFYQKELDFFISSSYGPGRYDARYEEEGLDYPIGYVRWTENRNMVEYVRLLGDRRIQVEPLVSRIYTVEEAPQAYAALRDEGAALVMVLLRYPQDPDRVEPARISNPLASPARSTQIRLALVGAGGFAKGMHLPNLQKLSDRYHLRAVVSRTGANATATARQFGAEYATTDFQEILEDGDIDAVLIATRHNLHAAMAVQALAAGKHVLVEKPLAVTTEGLDAITAFYSQWGAGIEGRPNPPLLLTGFNRRFSPFALRAHELLRARTNPLVITYRMNAGYLPLDHWTQGPEGGGRNVGEACHIYDLFTFLTGAQVVDVQAAGLRPRTGHYSPADNFVATCTFADGSVASLTYTALGAPEHPKEQMEVFFDGKVLVLDDYRRLSLAGVSSPVHESKVVDKGQVNELVAFADAVQAGGTWPIELWEQAQAMRIAFEVDSHIRDARGACAAS
ncbi:MAG: bi-domain-containing oxidoreductase [Thermoleophilia bacterium]